MTRRGRMTRDQLLKHSLAKPGAWEDHPWGEVTVKIFVFTEDDSLGVKCGRTRAEADEWVARFPDDARAMAYIGRYGWNTLMLGGAISDEELLEALDDSYAAVVGRLPRRDRPAGWLESSE